MDEQNREKALKILSEVYRDARPALVYGSAYQLLVAVILSAQCTDERVNKVTEPLFREYGTPERMILLTQEELERRIYSCGFYRMKAAHILSATADILEKYGGEVPEDYDSLCSLAGVGRKTANVVSAVWFGKDAIAVDTHVFRVSNRLGLAHASTPEKAERQLMENIPKKDWSSAHHWLIWHGRKVCRSQNPDCPACPLSAVCDYRLGKS